MKGWNKHKLKFYTFSFLKHDLKASITVFFVALPLCLGISLASGAPLYSGLLAGIIGGILVTSLSGSQLSVSGPAAGLTAISAAAIGGFSSIEIFFLSVTLAGILQIILGALKLGGFTHFIPSAVIKGMLTAIGILLISKQIPAFIGYDKPEFWSNELFNIITFNHIFSNVESLYSHSYIGVVLLGILSILFLAIWKYTVARKFPAIPASFITVIFGVLMALLFDRWFPQFSLNKNQFVNIPSNVFASIHFPDFSHSLMNIDVWKYAVIICFVASLETLLSIVAIDKLDPYNRITSQNRELIAQGSGNVLSGLLGGLPITAVIVRSSANAEAGARTKSSGIMHGVWLLLVVLFAVSFINMVPYCVLAVILIRTGYNLAKPEMILGVYRQGREQFLPFMITIVAILFTDLLIGVLVGIFYSIYFLVKHTYRAGYSIAERQDGHQKHFVIEMALNVSFLNKKRILEVLDGIPAYCSVEIVGTRSIYIDNDILEIIQDFKSKAKNKHIDLKLINIPEVQTIELH